MSDDLVITLLREQSVLLRKILEKDLVVYDPQLADVAQRSFFVDGGGVMAIPAGIPQATPQRTLLSFNKLGPRYVILHRAFVATPVGTRMMDCGLRIIRSDGTNIVPPTDPRDPNPFGVNWVVPVPGCVLSMWSNQVIRPDEDIFLEMYNTSVMTISFTSWLEYTTHPLEE